MSVWKSKYGVYLIAEIGGNHEGDFDKAKHLADLACSSGVDAVKFQIYTGDTICSMIEDPDRNAHFKRFELTSTQHIALAKQCHKYGVTYIASVWDINVIDWINQYLKFYKVGSGDLTAYPIIKKIAETGKPIIISTGLATLDEVREVVNYVQSINENYRNKEHLALLQCTAMYPIPFEDANLNVMDTYRREFGLTVGYSDHTVGFYAVEAAVAMGAGIIEMHFTDNREEKSFRDHQISFTKEEIQRLIEKINKIKNILGNGVKKPMNSEIAAGHLESFRRGIYLSRNLGKGTILKENDLVVLRPNRGIDARYFEKVIGKRLKQNLKMYEKIEWKDLD